MEPRRMLIVEDDPIIGRSLERRLRLEGFTITLLRSAREAQAHTEPVLVAVIDLNLPDGSGPEIMSDLLSRELIAHAVFFSATTDDRMVRRALELGQFVPKSAGVEAVVRAVHRALAEYAQRPTPPASATRRAEPKAKRSRTVTEPKRSVSETAQKWDEADEESLSESSDKNTAPGGARRG